MTRIACTAAAAFWLTATSAAATDTGVLLDRVECMGDSLLASTAMLLRQEGVEAPAQMPEGLAARQVALLAQAHGEPSRKDRDHQQQVFAGRALSQCLDRIRGSRP